MRCQAIPALTAEKIEFTANSGQGKPGMENKPTTASTARPASLWTRVYMKAVICLVVGLAAGYLFRGLQSPASSASSVAKASQPTAPGAAIGTRDVPSTGQTSRTTARPQAAMGGRHMPSLGEMKQMADTQAAPLLEKLKTDPGNSALLAQVGAIYHTTHQFNQAAVFYGKAVQADPRNVVLRTKLASSLYRGGDVDGAIEQLNRGLKYDPKDANSLFDLGMIKLQGKQDSKGALAAWQRLLKSNPQLSADRKATVLKLMADVLTTLGDQQQTQGGPSNDGHKSNIN